MSICWCVLFCFGVVFLFSCLVFCFVFLVGLFVCLFVCLLGVLGVFVSLYVCLFVCLFFTNGEFWIVFGLYKVSNLDALCFNLQQMWTIYL